MSHPWGCRQLHTGQFHLAHCKMEKQAGSDEARLCTQWLSRGAFLLQMGFWAVSGSRLHPSMKAESKHSYLRGGSSWGRYASIQHSISLQYFPSIKKPHNPLCQTAPALHPAQHDLEKPTGSLSPHSVEHAVTEPRWRFPSQYGRDVRFLLEAHDHGSPFLILPVFLRGLFVLPLTRMCCCMFRLRKHNSQLNSCCIWGWEGNTFSFDF